VVQFDILRPENVVIVLPHPHARAIAPAAEEAVQHGQKNNPFDGYAETPASE
jgi:hypothetical protein